MKTRKQKFIVQILDSNHQGITHASVRLSSDKASFELTNIDKKGRYTSEKIIPQGRYVITVTLKPFEDERRVVDIRESGQTEVFFMMRKGTAYYYRGKVKVPFTPDEQRLAIMIPDIMPAKPSTKKKQRFSQDKKMELAKSLAGKHKLIMEERDPLFALNGVYICAFPDNATSKSKQIIREQIESEMPGVGLPVMKLTSTGAALLTNEIMVKFEPWVEESRVEEIGKEYGLVLKRKIKVLGNLYHFTTGKAASYDTLEMINRIAELEEVVFAEPNLATTVEEDAVTPTDFLFPEQWDHQIINTPDAWQFLRNMHPNRTFGSPDIIIGVVDSGVDPNHPDLNGTVSDGSTKIYQAFDFSNMVANNNSLASGHGTSCASAAASLTNNASGLAGVNEGVAGVAGNCRILAIRRAGTEADYANIYLWAGGFDPDSDDDDFPAQINPGADVISSSIGLTSAIGSPTSGTMAAVFDTLTDDGRDGRGVLLFFSAANNGNDNDTAFDRPWGMYNRCFSIAASTLDNTGTNEVQANYSNFSSRTSFCAPSQDAFVGGAALHNPPANFGTFTATPTTGPEGHGTVGRPTVGTTLTAAANAGTNIVTVNSVAGLANGQAIFFGNPGTGNTEAHLISGINAGTNQVTLNRVLFNNQLNGTNVFASAPDYRSNFGGTSHATPICAGTAALMLSANNQLTWQQVGDLLKNTAIKINPGETNANGRWQDINGNFSNAAAYDGNPVFSEFYGFGRIDAATAVRQAGWDIELVTQALDFNDVPEGDTVSRAVRFNVKSLWPATFNLTPPGMPFNALSTVELLGASSDANLAREVYFWITYTGTNAGDTITMADGITVTVQNPETEQEWIIPVTANVIERQSAAIMLCLDQSGSMDLSSGIGSLTRMQVLRFSANIMIDVLHEHNGLGIVAFDHDPHDVLDFIGPVGPPVSPSNPFDLDRTNMKGAINGFNANPLGMTAIGDGIERAILRLDPVVDYYSKSIIVFTDGKETESKYLHEITDLISDNVFAIGLGKANAIEPSTLNEITNLNNGYMLLADDLGQDSIFKLAKYFLQIQAGVNNEDVIVDPDGTVYPGQTHRIPFVVNEADIRIDVIAMIPHPSSIEFYLETPGGQIITPTDAISTPGLEFGIGNHVVFYRMNVPVPLAYPEKEGLWHAVLMVNKKYGKNLSVARLEPSGSRAAAIGNVPYSLLVHTYSNLKMRTKVTQEHYEPGATVHLQVTLTQYGIPLDTNCKVQALITAPDKSQTTMALSYQGAGIYQAKMKAKQAGYYQFRLKAEGVTLRNKPFTREQVRSAVVYRGGNEPAPGKDGSESSQREELCALLQCMFSEKNISEKFKKTLMEQGIHIDGMLKCMKSFCKKKSSASMGTSTKRTQKLQPRFARMAKVYEALK